MSDIVICKASKINWKNSRPRRAGIVLFDNEGFYLGVDTRTGDLTDFGGQVTYANEDAITGAIREYNEETLDVFPNLDWLDVYNCNVIVTHSVVIFLVHVSGSMIRYLDFFQDKMVNMKFSELKGIKYAKRSDLETLKIFSLIRPLLIYARDNYDWSKLPEFTLELPSPRISEVDKSNGYYSALEEI
jgi:hypothetical protein